jgi:sugar lactone lactonase YvrE
MAMAPDGGHLYLAIWQPAGIQAFSRDAVTGAVTIGPYVATPGVFPQGIDFSPDGLHVYVTGQNQLLAYSRDHRDRHAHSNRPGDQRDGRRFGMLTALAVAVSPDGRNVYVSTTGKTGSPDGSTWSRSAAIR